MTTSRQLFFRLLRQQIDAEMLASARDFLAADLSFPAGGTAEEGPYAGLPELANPRQLAIALRWYAPSALLQWDWLRRIGHSACGHRPANTLLFRAYLDAVGLDEPGLALAVQYRALLGAAGIHAPSPWADDPALADAAYLAPCAALALACNPGGAFERIVGYSLAHCRLGGQWLDWLQRQLQRHGLPLGYVERHRQLLEHHGALLQAAMPAEGQGVAEGMALYEGVQQASAAALCGALADTPASRAERMLRGKLPYAIGHHGRIVLEGESLDQWMERGDLPALREALLRSRSVNTEALGDSPLLKAAEFGGAMFGVFSEEELTLLRRWLAEPDFSGSPVTKPFEPAAASLTPPSPVVGASALHGAEESVPARELYHRLLNRESHPASLPAAARYAEKVLAWARLSAPLQRGLRRRFPYSPMALKQRLDAIHHHEVERYRPLQGAPKLPRELFLWGVEQMAPAILVDGCWLENAAGAEPAADEARRRLLRTFADEAGAGRAEWNHPNVYRRLLESLDIRFAPIDSRDFVEDPRLSDAAFAIPAYLLAVGLWPERFFPELLGLNLAIELSGLGATYMRLAEALRYYGIDPTIVNLHLSIDNLATGHAALAREAIELYLERLRSLGGEAAMAPAWRRVWTGYLSLSVASLPFALSGLRRYGRWKLGEKARRLCHA